MFLHGKNITAYGEKDFSRIRGKEVGMIFQNPAASFSLKMKLIDGIAEGARYQEKLSKKELYEKHLT